MQCLANEVRNSSLVVPKLESVKGSLGTTKCYCRLQVAEPIHGLLDPLQHEKILCSHFLLAFFFCIGIFVLLVQ